MITLIHGASSLNSYNALKKFLDAYDELSVTRLSGKDADINQIKEAIETPSFTGQRLVIIEDLNSNRSSTRHLRTQAPSTRKRHSFFNQQNPSFPRPQRPQRLRLGRYRRFATVS